jgi:hypothetical protein
MTTGPSIDAACAARCWLQACERHRLQLPRGRRFPGRRRQRAREVRHGLAWTYAIGTDHNVAQATELWGQMVLRAGQLCNDERAVGSALEQSCREHGRAFIVRMPASPAPKAGDRSDAEEVP